MVDLPVMIMAYRHGLPSWVMGHRVLPCPLVPSWVMAHRGWTVMRWSWDRPTLVGFGIVQRWLVSAVSCGSHNIVVKRN